MDAFLNPTTIVLIGIFMFVELILLTRLFAKRNDQNNVGITIGNVLAGVFLMVAVAAEMSDQATWFTGLCLIGALAAHCAEVVLRIRSSR
ncbi:MAG: hypothetical protein AAF610_00315 [Pseudomonadota bacterium]